MMKVYFDNRGGTHSYVTIFCDDELHGRIAVDRDTINLIEIPDDVKVLKVSSVAIIYEIEELDKRIIENVDLCWEKEKIEEFGFAKREWQYPYDSIIYLDGSNGDIFIYQCSFPQEELAYALGYRGRMLSDGQQIKTKYVKRLEKFGATRYSVAQFILLSVFCVLGFVFFPDAIESLKLAKSHLEGRWALSYIGMCLLGIFYFLVFGGNIMRHDVYLQESKLKSEYYLDSDGNWSSSEK